MQRPYAGTNPCSQRSSLGDTHSARTRCAVTSPHHAPHHAKRKKSRHATITLCGKMIVKMRHSPHKSEKCSAKRSNPILTKCTRISSHLWMCERTLPWTWSHPEEVPPELTLGTIPNSALSGEGVGNTTTTHLHFLRAKQCKKLFRHSQGPKNHNKPADFRLNSQTGAVAAERTAAPGGRR